MHYLVIGHTGFKGSWLSLWLGARGHTVSGVSLDPPPGGLFELAGVAAGLANDVRLDIRQADELRTVVANLKPDVVMHLAAQPLVRESYRDPRTTFETNVMGTLNVLDAVAATPSVLAEVIVTTDKVYRNVDRREGYAETDPLGGDDPYSASKAMADLLAQSWTTSFGGAPSAIVRGGNVIGGGDVSADRLLPDLMRSFGSGQRAEIRFPTAVRPWQHVLDCLNGYLMVTDALLAGSGTGAWNIGPGVESFVPVGSVAELAAQLWGDGVGWTRGATVDNLHEANLLSLDATKARRNLGWENRVLYPESVEWTIDWQKRVLAGESALDVTLAQLAAFEARA